MKAPSWLVSTFTLVAACSAAAGPPIDQAALSASSDRFIVAGIDNAMPVMTARAGSSPRGYDGIVRYGPSPRARHTLKAVEHDYGLREINAWPIEALHMHCAVLRIPEGAERDDLLAKLRNDPRVRLAQPLQTFQTRSAAYNDPYLSLQRGFQEMNVAEAHTISRGEGVRISIIDTGADIDHPDLHGQVQKVVNVVDSDQDRFKRDRHGTELAGVIAAVANNHEGIVGVAPRARLVIIKACWQLQPDDDAAQCNSFTLAKGLMAALDASSQVVNLSLAGPADPLLRELIAAGIRRGVLFVGAAPADPGTASLMHGSGVIEVASEESPVEPDERIYAPGRDILTLLPGHRYHFATGTSLATAQVSGIVALMVSQHQGLSASAAREFLRQTSRQSVSTGSHPALGVDACAALVAASRRGQCDPPVLLTGHVANGS